MAAAMIHQHHEQWKGREREAHKEDPSCLQGRPPKGAFARSYRLVPSMSPTWSNLPSARMEAAKSTGSLRACPGLPLATASIALLPRKTVIVKNE